jgi:outer membrane phospholipase A
LDVTLFLRSACLSFLLSLWLLLPGAVSQVYAQAEDETGAIVGVVRDGRTGEPLGSVDVTYARESDDGTISMAQLQTVQTLPNGRFKLEPLRTGRYLLRAAPAGFPPGMTATTVTAGRTTEVRLILGETEYENEDVGALEPISVPPVRFGIRSEYFDMVGVNYFIGNLNFGKGTAGRDPMEYSEQVKFRVAFDYEAIDLFWKRPNNETGLYLAYEQNSFWHLYDESAPFFDNNYKPGAFLHLAANDFPGARKALGLPTEAALAIRGSLIHESNGRDGPANRSWNRWVAGIHAGRPTVSLLAGSFDVWHAFGLAPENADLLDFAGRAGAELFVTPFHDSVGNTRTLVLHARSRFFGKDPITNVEANLYYGFPGLFGDIVTPSLMIQVFSGYAENLLTYDERRTTVRVGIAIVR